MAEGDGHDSRRFSGRCVRRRGSSKSLSAKKESGGEVERSERSGRSRQARQAFGKQIGELFKGKGKDIRTIVPPFLTPLIPPGLLPTTSSETITTIPTPEPVLSSPPPPPSTTETPTTEAAPPILTLTPIIEPPPQTPPETTTTAPPIIIPVFPPPADLEITETQPAQLPPTETLTTQIYTSTAEPSISQPLPPPSEVSSASSSSSIKTFITLTSSTTATASLGIPNATYSATRAATEYTPNPAGRTAGIVVGTILGVALLIALILFWRERGRRRRRADAARASTPAGVSLLPAGGCFDVKHRDFKLGALFHRSSASPSWTTKRFGPPSSEIEKPAPVVRRKSSTTRRRFDEPMIPNITLTAVAEEDERRGGQSTRIFISRILPRQQSLIGSSSFLADNPPGGGDRQATTSGEPSRSNTPFRNSTMSEASSTWMTTATQKTDGEFVPPTALRYPSVPSPKTRQTQAQGGGGGEMAVPGPSRWLSPPSWRVMARRSLTRSHKSSDDDNGRSRSQGSSPPRAPGSSGSDKSLSEKGWRG
ncbi:hypothetical protein QBC37DRAFT_374418 [Rhypophila decipiens]|uniref:Uncharacterized protein n=1 Tax=Rhypophila decipiens TaxID=261697 RepID=A0AAN6Y6H0_9PEZI|nr:hypothetical protein QBC37DRAFT_374418 [Rhypophila decipiens]